MAGRRGRLLLFEPLWLPVCAPCHDWIHKRNPGKAVELGLLAPTGAFNDFARASALATEKGQA